VSLMEIGDAIAVAAARKNCESFMIGNSQCCDDRKLIEISGVHSRVLIPYFVITPNRLGIASCWALAWRQDEISAQQPEEEGRLNNSPTRQTQALLSDLAYLITEIQITGAIRCHLHEEQDFARLCARHKPGTAVWRLRIPIAHRLCTDGFPSGL
jgi:hypothetical protein